MKEIVIISGKGGTGKTSLTASFALLANNAVLGDCDVDAADLHLILTPTVRERHDFWSGHEAVINPKLCTPHGVCSKLCRFDAISKTGWKILRRPDGVRRVWRMRLFLSRGRHRDERTSVWRLDDFRHTRGADGSCKAWRGG